MAACRAAIAGADKARLALPLPQGLCFADVHAPIWVCWRRGSCLRPRQGEEGCPVRAMGGACRAGVPYLRGRALKCLFPALHRSCTARARARGSPRTSRWWSRRASRAARASCRSAHLPPCCPRKDCMGANMHCYLTHGNSVTQEVRTAACSTAAGLHAGYSLRSKK
jgi:hypothetical protein